MINPFIFSPRNITTVEQASYVLSLYDRDIALSVEQAKAFDDNLNAIPLLGFFSHVQIELQQAALTAGFDQVVPRSAFTKNLADILRSEPPA